MDRQAYDRMRVLQADHWWFRGKRTILKGLISRLDLPKSAKVLEVGCGPGGNLPMLQSFGEVTGLEPDEDSRVFAQADTGVNVVGGLLPDGLPFAPETFDLIAAFDVIEHVDEDRASVAALATLLKPGGYMATTVPAHPWMWSAHDALHHHKRRYTMAPYRALFEDAGLEVVKVSPFNTLLFPPIAAVRLIKSLLKAKGADDDAMPPKPINALLAGLFGAELAWLKFAPLPFGVSILLLARRPQ